MKSWVTFSLVFGGVLATACFLYFRASLPPLELSPEQETAVLRGIYLGFGGFSVAWLIGCVSLWAALGTPRETGTSAHALATEETGPYEWLEPALFGKLPSDPRLARVVDPALEKAA